MKKSKPRLAIGLGATCSGCDIAIVELGEKLLDVIAAVDIVFWPTIADFKLEGLKAMDDGSINATLFHGSIANEDNKEMAELLRQKSRLMVAFGSCACQGGIPGLANTSRTAELLKTVYSGSPSTVNPENATPKASSQWNGIGVTLPEKYDIVKTLDQVVDVDYYLPGCPPPVPLIDKAIQAIVSSALPPKGSVLAPDKTLCDECDRKRDVKKLSNIRRFYEVVPDDEKCLLEQGIVCMGPATRAGCETRCVNVNIPCRGCMGPPPAVHDQGSKMLSALASIIGVEEETSYDEYNLQNLVRQIKDPLGTFYMFGMPASTLKRKVVETRST